MEIESQQIFFKKIEKYYSGKIQDESYKVITSKLYVFLADYFFNQYSDFRKIYPKPQKRYLTLKLKDLENPLIHDEIISFLKEHNRECYKEICSKLFNMNKEDFIHYEQRRNNFENMF